MFVIFAVFLLATFVSSILYFEYRKSILSRKLKGFTQPKHVPILGVGNRFIGISNDGLLDIFNEIFSEVPKLPFQAWFGYQLVIGIADPINLQIILNSDRCINKPYIYQLFQCPTSIIATDREIWRPHRRALNTTFNQKMLSSYVPKINEKAATLADRLDPMVSGEANIDLYRMVFKCMMDIVACTTMGVDMEMQSPHGELYYRVAKMVMANIQRRCVQFWLRWDFIYRLTSMHRNELWALECGDQFLKQIYDTKVNEISQQNCDFLEMGQKTNTLNVIEKCLMLQREEKFSEQNVFDQMRVIYLAGIDTSSIAIFSTILLLAMHQEHQEKVVEELSSITESGDCDITYEHLSKMSYLECVFKEALRLFPPAPILARHCSDDIELSCGKIPKGTFLVVNIAHLHRNKKYWGSKAESFDPERFFPENSRERLPYSYLPFSGGPRNCIGLKFANLTAKIVIAHLLRRYKFTSDLKMEDIRTQLHLVLEISNENPIKIERRIF